MTSALDLLATRVGILPGYQDQQGRTHTLTVETRIALLAAMGFHVVDEPSAADALANLDAREIAALVPPSRVVRVDDPHGHVITLRLTPDECAGGTWWASIRPGPSEPTGELIEAEGTFVGTSVGTASVALPPLPPPGYYVLDIAITASGTTRRGAQRLIVAPERCWTREAEGRVWGIVANLYTVRDEQGWGVGNMSSLATLVEFAAGAGADFVGVNPLHALWNRGHDVSPYSPVSRLFRNPIYIDVEAVPELADSEEARGMLVSPDTVALLERVRTADRVAYEAIAELQTCVLRLLHAEFVRQHEGQATPRALALEAYRAASGPALDDHATFIALDERARQRGDPVWFREWTSDLTTRSGGAVPAAREELAAEIAFHRWVQFELDRQLGEVAATARRAGMRIGLYQDLAIGSSGGGSDAWAFDTSFAHGVSIGAPPDPLAEQGQNWGFPPLDPHQLRAHGFQYWTQLLRSAFRHAGALRLDHVLGLVRQFWIPHGWEGSLGGYVAFPAEELFGILALESVRHEAVVVGEDLGTVPPELPGLLERWGVLSSQVLYFEREADGGFRSQRAYRHPVLATVNTHDLAPLAGWWRGRDLELRHTLGLLDGEALHALRTDRRRDRHLLINRLVADGALDPAEGEGLRNAAGRADEWTGPGTAAPDTASTALSPDVPLLASGVHRLLRNSPAALVGLSLDDLAGETEPVNMPGVPNDRYESWTRRMDMPLERLVVDGSVREALG